MKPQKNKAYKTPEEKELRKKYLPSIQLDNFDELQQIAVEFKADLKLFFVSERKLQCTLMLLLALNLNAQEGVIVAGGNGLGVSYTIGNNLVELQIPIVEDEVSLSVPKFEIPIEKLKQDVKNKSIFEKILDFIRKLINKNK
jgi:hypothetical protein